MATNFGVTVGSLPKSKILVASYDGMVRLNADCSPDPSFGVNGIARYIDWIRTQSDIHDYFSEASEILRNKGVVHRAAK